MDAVSGFQWDDGNWPKCAKHGLSREEIEYVLSRKPMVAPDRTGASEARFNAVGRTEEGRHVFVVFAVRRDGADLMIRPISARYMHKKEVDHYERQRSP